MKGFRFHVLTHFFLINYVATKGSSYGRVHNDILYNHV